MTDAPDPLRILHLTDPHLFATPLGKLRGTVTRASLLAVLAHYEHSEWQADCVAMTGDTVQDDSLAAYQQFRRLMLPLGLPVYCVPGNHDVTDRMQHALAGPPFSYCEAVRLGQWLVIGIDSCNPGQAGGLVSDPELQRLEQNLRETDARYVTVCLHHPPVKVHSRWLDSVGLDNAAALLAVIAASKKVRLVLFGHVHQAVEVDYGRTRIIGTPSTCAQFKPHSDEFAVDENPPAYRRVELFHNGDVSTELVWVGGEM